MASDKQFFQLPSVLSMFLVTAGIVLLFFATFAPATIPCEYLGPLGWLIKYLVADWPVVLYALVTFAIVAHALEAYFALNTAINKGIESPAKYKWCVSVALFGYFSYQHLLAYKPTKNK